MMKIYKPVEINLYKKLMEIRREQLKNPSVETRVQSESVGNHQNSETSDARQKGEGQAELWQSFDKLVEQIESDRFRKEENKRNNKC